MKNVCTDHDGRRTIPSPGVELAPADQAAHPPPERVGEDAAVAEDATVVLPAKDERSGAMAHATG